MIHCCRSRKRYSVAAEAPRYSFERQLVTPGSQQEISTSLGGHCSSYSRDEGQLDRTLRRGQKDSDKSKPRASQDAGHSHDIPRDRDAMTLDLSALTIELAMTQVAWGLYLSRPQPVTMSRCHPGPG